MQEHVRVHTAHSHARRLAPGGQFTHGVPAGWNGFAYVYEGSGSVCGTRGAPQQVRTSADRLSKLAP